MSVRSIRPFAHIRDGYRYLASIPLYPSPGEQSVGEKGYNHCLFGTLPQAFMRRAWTNSIPFPLPSLLRYIVPYSALFPLLDSPTTFSTPSFATDALTFSFSLPLTILTFSHPSPTPPTPIHTHSAYSITTRTMATVKSRFDASASVGTLQESDGPWLTTYSRALCSIYPKDEEGCWDYLLSTQPSSIFSKQPEDVSAAIPTAIPNAAKSRRIKRSGPAVEDSDRIFSTTLSSSFPSSAPNGSSSNNNNTINSSSGGNTKYSEIGIALTSPAKLSHALCKIGFDCIDYFTATQDDLVSEPPQPSPSRNSDRNNRQETLYTSPLLHELSDSDWRTGLAAAVGGKRAAALERKRALSRTMSQEEVMASTAAITVPTTYGPRSDPWFQTLDRLSRWDEVAYR